MEEDIKILEEFIKDVIPEYTETYVNGKKVRINLIEIEPKPSKKTAQAIENLLKRYKELEEGCKTCVIRNDLNDYVENSIPISVIQNKLEQNKAKTDCRYCNNACDSYAVCTALKEILEKGNK